MSADTAATPDDTSRSGEYTLAGVRPYGGDRTDVIVRARGTASMESTAEKADCGAKSPAERIIDARDLVLLPGLVDLHTHLREPGREEAETITSGPVPRMRAVSPMSSPWPTPLL